MDINKSLLKAITDSMDYKGMSIEIRKGFDLNFIRVDEESKKDNIRTYLSASVLDSNMFLYVIARMLEENALTITFNENATEKDINYLEKLSKGFSKNE